MNLLLHGVDETAMRRALIERDLVECVLGLGPNLFYNSPMEACVVVCRTRKAPDRRGKVLFLGAVHQIARERSQSFLTPEHQTRILTAHALVLRAKSGVVLPEFLPFFMQSDSFMRRAEAISVGSLSPTINWRTLAKHFQEKAAPNGFGAQVVTYDRESCVLYKRALDRVLPAEMSDVVMTVNRGEDESGRSDAVGREHAE